MDRKLAEHTNSIFDWIGFFVWRGQSVVASHEWDGLQYKDFLQISEIVE